jgi:hypothetical protein
LAHEERNLSRVNHTRALFGDELAKGLISLSLSLFSRLSSLSFFTMASLPAVSQRALERLEALRLSRASRQDMAEGPSNHEEEDKHKRRRRRVRTRTHPLATRGVGPQTAVEISTFQAEDDEVTGQFW